MLTPKEAINAIVHRLRALFTDPASDVALVRRIFADNFRSYLGKYALGIGFMGIVAAGTAANAWIIRDVVNGVFLERQLGLAWVMGGAVMAIAVVKGFATYGQTVVLTKVGASITASIRRRVFEKILALEIGYFSSSHSSQIISQVSWSAGSVRAVIDLIVTGLGRDLLTVIFLAGVMILQDPLMALFALVVGPPVIFGVSRLARRVRNLAQGEFGAMTGIVRIVQESAHGIRIVKSFGLEPVMRERMAGAVEEAEEQATGIARLQASVSPLTETLGGICIGLVIVYAAWQVLAQGKTPGEFISFLTAFLLAYEPAKRVARLHISLAHSLQNARRVFELLDRPTEDQDSAGATDLPAGEGRVQIDDVKFGYQPNQPILHGVTIEAGAGELVALVGPSGGGKTTILNLILRFYEPWSGAIRFDGLDVREVRRQSLRQEISLVTQDVFLFSGTVRENIRLGRSDATDEDIDEAARAANADGFIKALPNGYDTLVGENGMRLSGGQRQRLAIARAIVKHAPVLLLDEATSSLDTESERQVQVALDRLMTKQTTIVIAHRLSTIVRADRIYVIKDGRVVGVGTHASLIAERGLYADLFGAGQLEPAKAG